MQMNADKTGRAPGCANKAGAACPKMGLGSFGNSGGRKLDEGARGVRGLKEGGRQVKASGLRLARILGRCSCGPWKQRPMPSEDRILLRDDMIATT